MTPPTTPPTTRLTARSPEDLLAVVPVVLGFEPHESVVMLTFGARHPFHARVDLPPPEHAAEVLGLLLEPALRHDVERVVLVVYAAEPRPADGVGRTIAQGFRDAGVDVVDVIRADGSHWFPLLGNRRDRRAGVPYDVSSHPFAAQAVLDGRVTHGSRDDLAATLVPEPARVAALAVVAASTRLAPPAWVSLTCDRLAADHEPPDDATAARLLLSVARDVACRDAAWVDLSREVARDHVELWSGLLRRAPDDLAASAAAVLGLVAWLAGHGALAWCAVDRAEELAPGHTLAALVADLLTQAVPPTLWPQLRPGTDTGEEVVRPA